MIEKQWLIQLTTVDEKWVYTNPHRSKISGCHPVKDQFKCLGQIVAIAKWWWIHSLGFDRAGINAKVHWHCEQFEFCYLCRCLVILLQGNARLHHDQRIHPLHAMGWEWFEHSCFEASALFLDIIFIDDFYSCFTCIYLCCCMKRFVQVLAAKDV